MVLRELKTFDNLTHLHLPDARDLGVGFEGGHWCGHAYRGPSGRKYGREISRKRAEAMEVAGAITMGILPHLTSLTIESEEATMSKGDDGQPVLSWPWTGGIDKWLYEIWPEPPLKKPA